MQINIHITEAEARDTVEQMFRKLNSHVSPQTAITISIVREDIPNYEWARNHKAFMAKFTLDTITKLNLERPLLHELKDAVWEQLGF